MAPSSRRSCGARWKTFMLVFIPLAAGEDILWERGMIV